MFPAGHRQLATSLNNLGGLLQDQGEHAKALSCFQRALQMYESLYPKDQFPGGHPLLAMSLNNLGNLLRDQGEYAKALTFFQRALDMYEALHPKDQYPAGHPHLAASLNNLGSLLMAQGEYAKALTCCQRTLEMREKLFPKDRFPAGHPDLASSLNNLGHLLNDQGEYAKALPLYQRALAMNEALYPRAKYPAGHHQLALSLNNLGGLLIDQGEYAKALSFLQRGLDMDQELIDIFVNTAAEAEALNRLAQLPFTRDAYLSVSRHLPDAQQAVFASLWRSKAVLTHLLERRRQALLLSDDPACRDLAHQLTQTRQMLARLLLAPPDTFPDQARRVQQLNDRKEDLERQLGRKLPSFAALKARDTLTPQELLPLLPGGTVVVDLVRYFRFEQDPRQPGKAGATSEACYLAFVLAKGQPLRRVELGPAQPVEQALDDWRRALESWQRGQASDTGSRHAATLRKLLWEPVARHFPARTETVLLAPDGPLAFLPWAALPGQEKGTVLLEEHAQAIVPSARFVLERLLDKPAAGQPTQGLLLAVGAVQYDGEARAVAAAKDDLPPLRAAEVGAQRQPWNDLPGTARELERLLALKGGREVRQRRGAEASVGQLMLDLPEARWAHLATHGFFADARFRTAWQLDEAEMKKGRRGERVGLAARNPLVLSGLVLAGANRPRPEGGDDGILTAEAIAGLRLERLDLAVLSACESGLGDTGEFKPGTETKFGRAGGEGVYGLQRAFHIAGAKNVVASLWQVDDQATAALMALFYHKLWQDNQPPLLALRQAQLHLYRHPEAIPVLAGKRGPDFDREVKRRVEPKPLPGAKSGDRAGPPLWAGFVLSGLGL